MFALYGYYSASSHSNIMKVNNLYFGWPIPIPHWGFQYTCTGTYNFEFVSAVCIQIYSGPLVTSKVAFLYDFKNSKYCVVGNFQSNNIFGIWKSEFYFQNHAEIVSFSNSIEITHCTVCIVKFLLLKIKLDKLMKLFEARICLLKYIVATCENSKSVYLFVGIVIP